MRDTEGYLLYLNANSFHTLGASNMKVLHGCTSLDAPYRAYMLAFYASVLQVLIILPQMAAEAKQAIQTHVLV
jgi:hypothetical protein